MAHQNSLRFYGDVAYERYGGLVLGHEEGARLARAWRSLPPPATLRWRHLSLVVTPAGHCSFLGSA